MLNASSSLLLAILIWIQLWPPLYAVLNYMASIYAAYDLAAAADLGTGAKALSLQTASTIYSRAISGEAVVGYLAISIPFIAWAALKRMENFGTALVGGLSGLQGMLSGSTGSAAVGNVNMGNVAMDQLQLAPNRTSAFMSSWQNDLTGNTASSNALTGRTAMSLLRNQGFASRVVSMRVSEQDVTEASRQADAARSEAVSATQDRSAVLTDAFTRGLTKLRSTRSTSGSNTSSFEQLGQTMNRLDQITKSVADSTGMSQSQVARIAFGASGHLGLNTSFAGAQANANAEKTYLASLSDDQRKVLGSMSSDQIAEFKQFGDRVSRDSSLVNTIANDSRDAREMASRIATTTSRAERAEANFSERSGVAERLSSARERGETISIDMAQDPHNLEMFMRYAERYGGSSAAAFAMLDAELARQGLRPNRSFSDGTALPSSFDDLHRRHQLDSAAPELNPDVAATARSQSSRVSAFETASPAVPEMPPPSTTRSEIQGRAAEIRAQAESSQRGFESKAEIVRAPDGTVTTKKSLMLQSSRQVGKDAGASIDAAQDAVKDAFRKKK